MGNSMTDNTIPTVVGRLTPSGTQIAIKCPYSDKKHLHGAPEGDEAEHRRGAKATPRNPHTHPGRPLQAFYVRYVHRRKPRPLQPYRSMPNWAKFANPLQILEKF
jgi:hypothetical protein